MTPFIFTATCGTPYIIATSKEDAIRAYNADLQASFECGDLDELFQVSASDIAYADHDPSTQADLLRTVAEERFTAIELAFKQNCLFHVIC